MKYRKTFLVCVLCLVIFAVACNYLDLGVMYWKYYREQEIFCKKIDNVTFCKKIKISPVRKYKGCIQAALYTQKQCYGILYDENQENVFLSKGMWRLCGLSYIVFYYKINAQTISSQIKQLIRECKKDCNSL